MSENKKEVIERVKKILALAGNNPNQNEAIAAALKAQELMAKFNIKESELGNEITEDKIDSMECVVTGKTQKWRLTLAVVIAKNFRCKVYLNGNGHVTFYGYDNDAAIAKEVFLTMYAIGVKLSNKEKKEARKESGTAKGIRNTFCLGFVNGIKSELEKQCTALMIVTPKEVEESYQEKFKFGKTTKASLTISSDRTVYEKGFQAGKDAIKGNMIEGK